MMKLNFWQWLGVILLVLGAAFYIYESRTSKPVVFILVTDKGAATVLATSPCHIIISSGDTFETDASVVEQEAINKAKANAEAAEADRRKALVPPPPVQPR